MGGRQTLPVFFWPEELDRPGSGAVGLEPLKALLRIVEHQRGGIQRDGGIGNNSGVVPALTGGVIHQKHMVGKKGAKAERTGWLLFGMFGLFNLNLEHLCPLTFPNKNRDKGT